MQLLITGSSTGIGRSVANHLLSQGHHVWGIARSDQSKWVNASPATTVSSCCDVSVWPELHHVACDVSARWGQLDGLIVCAGIQGAIGRTLTIDPTQWAATVRSNLEGAFNTLRAFAPLLRSAPRRAKVICFSGGGATKARANFSAYGAAKTAIVRLVETVAEEERGQPLDINAIAPGAFHTRLTDEVLALGPDVVGAAEFAAAQKQKATGGASIAMVCGLIDWLLSPESDGISGRLLAAPWDPWASLGRHKDLLSKSDIYTLRRIVPEDRGQHFS